jgi:hypothetical protein
MGHLNNMIQLVQVLGCMGATGACGLLALVFSILFVETLNTWMCSERVRNTSSNATAALKYKCARCVSSNRVQPAMTDMII